MRDSFLLLLAEGEPVTEQDWETITDNWETITDDWEGDA